MNREHVISGEVMDQALIEFSRNCYWVAYNTIPYFLEKGDVYFFRDEEAAKEFSWNNVSEYDDYEVLYIRSVDELLKQIPYGEKIAEQLFNSKNLSIMNENNLKYLQDNLKYHGFGETLNPELENQLEKGNAEFSLAFKTEVNKKGMEATLHFKKSETTDNYFFNKYDARTKNEKDETMAQTFYLNKGSGVTLKEAFNLLNGRAVFKELTNKEDQKYKAWVQLDFSVKDKHGNYDRKTYHENYGYNLKETLNYYPIREMMKEDDMKNLIRSLEKGNVQMVTLETSGKNIKVFIEADPKYKGLNVYTGKMVSLDKDQKEELMKKPEMKEDKELNKNKEQKQSLAGEGQDEKKQGRGRKKVNGEESGLLPKKRISNKKGLSV